MTDTLDLTLRLSGTLRDHVIREIHSGDYASTSEYVRDLIRRDRREAETRDFEVMKAERQLATAIPDTGDEPLTLKEII